MRKQMIKKYDKVLIKKEWQDDGDDLFDWIAIDDEVGGRVTIMPTNTNMPIPPQYRVETNMLELVKK